MRGWGAARAALHRALLKHSFLYFPYIKMNLFLDGSWITDNAGWDDNDNRFGVLQQSRNELLATIDETHTTIPVTTYQADHEFAHLFKALQEDGVVKIRGLFTDELIEKLKNASEKSLYYVQNELDWTRGGARESQEIVPNADNHGLQWIIRHSNHRYDISPVDSEYLVPELKDNVCPPLLHKLLSHSMGCCGWKVNSCGFMPLLPQGEKGDWHRDTRVLFHWGEEANGNTNVADRLDVTRLPDYYFTLVVNLNSATEEDGGETEFVLGSHKKGILEAVEEGTFAVNCGAEAGDAVLFNGKMIHRGRQSTSSDKVRHALYIVYSATWYYNS
jgi:hypothetical protein